MPRPIRRSERHAALFIGDAVALTVAVVVALWTWSLTAGFPFDARFLLTRAVWFLAVPLWLVALVPTRRGAAALDVAESMKGLARVVGAQLVVYFAVFFVAGTRLPRLVALYILWDGTLLVLGWRLVAQWSLTRAPFSRRLIVAGSGRALDVARDVLSGPEFRDVQVVQVVDSSAAIDEIAAQHQATGVVVAIEKDVDDSWVRRLLACQERGVEVVRMTQLYEETRRRVPVGHLESSWLITNFFDVARFRDSSPLAKRAFDLVVGAVLGVVAIAATPFVAIVLWLDSGLPLFYRQRRLGRGGREFTLTKFRTMTHDAEKDGAAQWSPEDDPRVTRVGWWLRRTRLDELPNVLAILRGDMSVVGPRPERPEFIERLEREVPFYRARLIVRPGLTGWAQVNVPYGDSVGDATVKLEYDLYYIKHQSFWFDILIMLKTVGTILRLAGR